MNRCTQTKIFELYFNGRLVAYLFICSSLFYTEFSVADAVYRNNYIEETNISKCWQFTLSCRITRYYKWYKFRLGVMLQDPWKISLNGLHRPYFINLPWPRYELGSRRCVLDNLMTRHKAQTEFTAQTSSKIKSFLLKVNNVVIESFSNCCSELTLKKTPTEVM